MSDSRKSTNDLEFTNRINKLYQQKCSKYSNIHDANVLPAVDRIIVIGDLHGDFDKTIQCLKLAKVLQEDNKYDTKLSFKLVIKLIDAEIFHVIILLLLKMMKIQILEF